MNVEERSVMGSDETSGEGREGLEEVGKKVLSVVLVLDRLEVELVRGEVALRFDICRLG